MQTMRIDSISVENLRGYEYTSLRLQKLTVLVGENNEGKSSLLKMLERFLLIQDSFWLGDRVLTEPEFEFWYPANDARHKARRLTIQIEFLDGRAARRFSCQKNSLLALRFAIDSSRSCRLNLSAPRRSEQHDSKAVELLRKLKEQVALVLLPPVRDARSSIFADKATRSVKEALIKKLGHSKQAGAPKEYRLALDAIRKIQDIVALHSGELSKSSHSPLASMLRSSEVRVELFPKDIYELIEKCMFVYLSTGAHDDLKVLPGEVGNGLQSLIDIDLTLEWIVNQPKKGAVIVVIEEPEAFLHPSAQRQFMQFLRRALVSKVQAAILTTHSPIILDEATYEEIVLVRNQKHFAPTSIEEDRSSINTSLMTTASSEVFFARTVVLVEGEGDKAFLNTLFRRIRNRGRVCSELSGLVFQAAGGCTFYSPWLKLVRSYRTRGADPFECVWLMDGDAATSAKGPRPVMRTAYDCGFNLQPAEVQAIEAFGDLGWGVDRRVVDCADSANDVLRRHGGHLFCCDFEWALFNGSSQRVVAKIKAVMTDASISVDGDSTGLARRLGSKIESGKTSDGAKKQPYIRALIAESLHLSELPPEIHKVVLRILTVCFRSKSKLEKFLESAEIASC